MRFVYYDSIARRSTCLGGRCRFSSIWHLARAWFQVSAASSARRLALVTSCDGEGHEAAFRASFRHLCE